MKRLDGRVAVVTGAGSGIGRATSLALALRGCAVAVVDIDDESAAATATLIRSEGASASTHRIDVRDRAAIDRLVDEVVDQHGAVHVLVNNAGVTSAGGFADESEEDLRWIVDINVWGVVNGCHAFLPALLRAEEAHIVNLSSMVGLLGLPHNASYSLTKGAVRALSEALRAELVTTNVGVSCVFPGAIHTNIMSNARGTQGARLASLGSSRLAPLLLTSPDVVARRIVKAIERNRPRVLVGADSRAVDAISRIAPGRSGLIGRVTARLDR